MPRRAVWPLLSAALLAACSGSSQANPCHGLPTAKHSAAPLVLFGAIHKLGKPELCKHFGRPTSTKRLSDGREVWKYDNATFVLSRGHVVSYHP